MHPATGSPAYESTVLIIILECQSSRCRNRRKLYFNLSSVYFATNTLSD